MDSKYRYLSIFQNYGGLWNHYDWQKALTDGAKASGLPYSGSHEFVKTAFYGSINHEVAPKEKSLKCGDCHFGSNKRLDWKALGYAGDPMRGGWAADSRRAPLLDQGRQNRPGKPGLANHRRRSHRPNNNYL